MPSPVLLYTVLTEEFESQGLKPPFPREALEEQFQRRLPELDAQLGTLRESDAEEYERNSTPSGSRASTPGFTRTASGAPPCVFRAAGSAAPLSALGSSRGSPAAACSGGFDYLSTVSGGGYLGSWLTGWILPRSAEVRARTLGRRLQEVESRLRSLPESPLEPEPMPVLTRAVLQPLHEPPGGPPLDRYLDPGRHLHTQPSS